MKFGVIYDVTMFGDALSPYPEDRCPHKIADLDPKRLRQRRTWTRTEAGKKCVERDYPEDLPVQAYGKWCALLTKEQFKAFAEEFGFAYKTKTNTMGAIGMPGSPNGYECMPAWSFDSYEYRDCLVNVFVTPYPDIEVKTGASCTEKNIDRIVAAMAELFPW